MAKGATHVLGLDIGNDSIKLVELSLTRGGVQLVSEPAIVPTPAGAVSGRNWRLGLDRDRFFNALDCQRSIIEYGKPIGRSEVTCGRCIKACPWTQKYLAASLSSSTPVPQT